jgi:hypothetical protein
VALPRTAAGARARDSTLDELPSCRGGAPWAVLRGSRANEEDEDDGGQTGVRDVGEGSVGVAVDDVCKSISVESAPFKGSQ